MEYEEEMDFGEDEGKPLGDATKDRLKNLFSAPSKAPTYRKALVTADYEENDSDFGEGARGISLEIEGARTIYSGFTCTREEYEVICRTHNASDTLVGTTVEVNLSNGIVVGIR